VSIAIPKTRLSTPLVGGQIDIEQGFKLFGSGMQDLPLGKTFTILPTQSKDCTVGPLRVSFDVQVLGSAGLLGPGVGVAVALEGTADGSTATFTATESKIGAGMEFGLQVRLIMTVELQRWTVDVHWTGSHWHRHLTVTSRWVNEGGISVDMTIDLSAIIIDYLLTRSAEKKQTKGEPKKLGAARFQTGTGLSMVDYDPGVVSTNLDGSLAATGSAHVEPTMWVMVNLANYFDAPGPMKRLHDWLVDSGGDFFLGPTLNLTVPTTVELTAVATDGVSYKVDSVNRGQVACSRQGTSTVATGRLQATFKHSAGMAFGLGLGIGLHVFKIFGFYQSTGPVVDFVSLLGYSPNWSADVTREAAYGAAFASAEPLREAVGARYEVVLEEPAGRDV
jgi:hypothetical protein